MKKHLAPLFGAMLLATGIFAGPVSQAGAAPLYRDGFEVSDFQDYAITPPETRRNLATKNNPKWWNRSSTDASKLIEIEIDEENRFGSGTKNQVLRLERKSNATGAFNLHSMDFTPITTGVIEFDFHVEGISGERGFLFSFITGAEPQNFDAYDLNNMTGSIFITDDQIHHGKSNTMYTGSGQFFSFDADQKNTLSIIFNNSASLYTYQGQEVASATMHLLLNGEFKASWAISEVSGSNVGDPVNALWLNFPADANGVIRLDNITVIPEPHLAVTVLPALGVLCFLHRRRTARRED